MGRFSQVCLLFLATIGLPAADLTLTVEGPRKFYLDAPSPFKAKVANHGNVAVTLVVPADGSESGWRTPVIGWSAIPLNKKADKHPAEPPPFKGRDCGVVSAARREDIFTLGPGESREFSDWIFYPQFKQAGKYRVVFYYNNDPSLRVGGLTPRPHDEEAIQRMSKSTPCSLMSNEIVVEVWENRPLFLLQPQKGR